MECDSEQTYAIFVDGELADDESQRVREHLAGCGRCRALVDALRAENRTLSESLRELPEEAVGPAPASRLRWSWVWGDLAAVAAVVAVGSVASIWLSDVSIPDELQWVNPLHPSGSTNLIFNLSYYFAHGGSAMLADYASVVGWLCLLLVLGGAALLVGRRWRMPQPGTYVLIVLLALSLPSFALERRHGEVTTVAANETVDDSLLATGDTVRVDGVVNGDLLAGGRTVQVQGTVKGDLLVWAQRTVVSGTVEGRIFTFSQSLDLDGQLGHSLYGWVQSLRVDNKGRVGDGIVAGAGDVSLEGQVTRGVNIFAGNADVSGNVGRDLTVAGGKLTLTSTARVGGNLTASVHHSKDVHIADGATITGKRDIQTHVRKSRFSSPRFYFHQAVWLVAAMLVGWLGLALFPSFFQASTQAVGSTWRSLGLGLGVLAGAPVVMVVAAVTLVGIPISLMLLAVYLAAIYLAKIWVGAFLGRVLLKPAVATKRDWLLGLLVGLLILTIVGVVPYLGSLVRLVVVCLGLGAFAWQAYHASRPVVAA
jgi:cytoskeletal protein CcmA (bactofilin family)